MRCTVYLRFIALLEVKAAKVTGKLILALLKKLMKEAKKLGGLEKLVKVNGNEVKLKDMAKKGQLEEIPVEEAELKELKKELNKYGVKFSVMKDKEKGKYAVFFQAKDMKMMEKAFKNALARFAAQSIAYTPETTLALRPTAVGIFAPSGTGFRISGEGMQVGYAFSRLGHSTSHPSKEEDV